ncbi:MAG: efflux RND transporter periplasmic adaptor subunit [Pseudomonadota bacterium]
MFRFLLSFGRKAFTVLGTIAIFVGAGVLFSIMGAARPQIERQEPEVTPPTVFYQIAEEQAVTLDVLAQGEVRPRTDISLTAQISGKVVKTSDAFVNGGAFEEGDLLVQIEDTDYKVAVTSARARVAQAEEALRREEAEAALARRDYEDLGREGDPSDLTLRLPQLAQARANFEAARADLSGAQLNLDRTSIRAPFKGRVRERIAGVGQFVSPGAQIGRIFSTDIAEIRLPLTDSDLAKLGLPIAFVETPEQPGPEVELSSFVAGDMRKWTARVTRTDGAIDAATRQISVIAEVDDPYGAGADENGTPLAVGLFVDAHIEGKPYANAIVLPRSALYGRDQIYVIKSDDTLEERTVAIVSTDRDTITISGGIAPGERIAISPLRGAENGDKVIPQDPALVGGDEPLERIEDGASAPGAGVIAGAGERP